MDISQTKHLQYINSPAELKKLTLEELVVYCDELRQYIINEVSNNPGHFASSLGAVELSVAVHYVYDTPTDKLVWDVGHQAYAHKIVTGRRDQFPTNRMQGGISGFPLMAESQYDAFGSGHASTSISAAFGMATAAKLNGEQTKTIAVIGDGAMTGGLAFEGLNNAGAANCDILVILNDNNHSIDPNVGAIKEYLLGMTLSGRYNRMKNRVWRSMERTPRFRHTIQKIGRGAKAFFLHSSNLFESMGFRYFGPTDGNDITVLVRALRELQNIPGAKILHIYTVKGKGYEPAEDDHTTWHAPGKFNPATGVRPESNGKLRYQEIFGHTLVELARQNDRILGITPAMPSGCSLSIMMEEMPERAFDVGIAEGHAVTFSAGLAAAGKLPFCNIYSTFSQRAIDNIIHDVALQRLEVVMCLDRAGLVGEDGSTHQGTFDVALLRSIPNVIIASPASAVELRNIMYTASLGGYHSCFVIRYPRGGEFASSVLEIPFEKIEIGKARLCNPGTPGGQVAILSLGRTIDIVARAARETGATHYDLRFVKPLDSQMLHHLGANYQRVVVVEDNMVASGVGSAILEFFNKHSYTLDVRLLGVDDYFVTHATIAQQLEQVGLTTEKVIEACQAF